MAIRKDLDGLRMQLPGAPEIYLIDQGRKRHIPDPATYNNLFHNWNGIVQDPHLNNIDTGTPLSHGAVLAQAQGDAAVYLVDDGVKRHIASPATMERYYFDWNKIQHVAAILVRSIQSGPTIAWPE